jgi:hypothetical protein
MIGFFCGEGTGQRVDDVSHLFQCESTLTRAQRVSSATDLDEDDEYQHTGRRRSVQKEEGNDVSKPSE